MDTQKIWEKYNSYLIILISIFYGVGHYFIWMCFNSDIFKNNFDFIHISLSIWESILIGFLVSILTKSDITKGIIYGFACGIINGIISIIFTGLHIYIVNTIIYGTLFGALVSILTKSDITKGVTYGIIYGVVSSVIISSLVSFGIFYNISKSALFSVFISMLIESKGKYITRNILAGIIFGILSYSIYTYFPDVKNIFVLEAFYVNYLYFILYPLALQKNNIPQTQALASVDDASQIKTEKEIGLLESKGKVKWGLVISCVLIGACVGTFIVYVFLMLTSNRYDFFGFDFKEVFAIMVVAVYLVLL